MVQRYTSAALALILSAAALLAGPAASRAATIPSHLFAAPDGGTVTLRGSISPLTQTAHRLGRPSSSRQLGVTVTLALRDQSALGAFLDGVYDPSSPSYHQFLTTKEFSQRFGTDAASHHAVTSWLRGSGLRITGTSPNGMQIFARGTVPALQHAFHTSLYSYGRAGGTFVANADTVEIPAALSGTVVSVTGLSTAAHQQPQGLARAGSSAPDGGYGPDDLRSLYNTAPLVAGGNNGAGQTIGVAGFADFGTATVSTFDKAYGLTNAPTRIAVSDGRSTGAPSGYKNGQVESDLDVEVAQGAAPGASILMYEAPNTDQGAINLFNKIVSDNKASVITTSWGDMEANYTPSVLTAMHQAFEEAAAQGQTVFAASGDAGAYDGTAGTPAQVLAVDYPASDPWVTSVGGTALQSNGGQYAGETAWLDTTDPKNPGASGGGLSEIFSRPDWQTGPGVDNQYSNGKRQIPDVAADADVYTGYAVYSVSRSGSSAWTQVGGTSAAAPLWAGFGAILNNAMGKRIGFLNGFLYRLGAGASTLNPSPYHDVTSGNNLYYKATAGWDYATGWGSFNGVAFLAALRALPAPTATPIRSPTPEPTSTPVPTATSLPTVRITRVLLLHRVNGKLVTTKSLKTGETGKIVILYASKNAAGSPPSGRVMLRQKGKAFKTLTPVPGTYSGKRALVVTVKVTSKSRVGKLLVHATVFLGSLSTSLDQPFKLLAGK